MTQVLCAEPPGDQAEKAAAHVLRSVPPLLLAVEAAPRQAAIAVVRWAARSDAARRCGVLSEVVTALAEVLSCNNCSGAADTCKLRDLLALVDAMAAENVWIECDGWPRVLCAVVCAVVAPGSASAQEEAFTLVQRLSPSMQAVWGVELERVVLQHLWSRMLDGNSPLPAYVCG